MKIMRQMLSGMAMGIGVTIGLMAGTAHALDCPIVFDPVRTTWFTTQGISRTTAGVEEMLKKSSKEKELELWEKRRRFKDDDDGDDGEDESSGGSEQQFPEGIYYDYMKGAAATGSEERLPSQSDAEEQEKYVREHFFYNSDVSNVTEEDKQKVLQLRQTYLEDLAKEVLSLSVGARENIASELGIIKDAKTTAGGVIQQVDLLAQTKKVMVEQKAADILLQAKLLEMEAAQLLTNLDPQRVENPNKNNTSGNNSGGTPYGNYFNGL